MKIRLIGAAVIAATLSGCAGLSADVQASNPAGALQGERTYALARAPSQQAGADPARYETLVKQELARCGLADAAPDHAHYLLSLAYETRRADIGVETPGCTGAACGSPAEASFSLFGGHAYKHSLTLRFFERTSGDEVYKVSATSSDRDAEPLHAVPYLVKSALAKFPFADHPDWRVTLRTDNAGGTPEVVSVKPVERVER